MKKGNVVLKCFNWGILFLLLGAGFVEATTSVHYAPKQTSGDPVEVIDQQQTQDCGHGFSFYNEYWLAQGFVPRIPSLTKVDVFIFRAGNPSPDVQLVMNIRLLVNGENLANSSVSASIVPDGPGDWIEFDFPNVQLTTDWTHYIVLHATGGSSTDCYNWLFGINDPYPNGDAEWSYTGGFSWDVLNPDGYPHPDCCFRTHGLEQPPTTPTIDGPAKATVGNPTRYYFNSTDPDGNFVQYLIDWGDGQTTGWTGINGSGSPIWIDHTWEKRGSYTIKAKARDTQLAESDWATLPIQNPLSLNLSRQRLFDRLLERFPHAFPILQMLRG